MSKLDDKLDNLGDTTHIALGCYLKLNGVYHGKPTHELELKYAWLIGKPYLRCKRCSQKFKYVSKSEKYDKKM